LINKQTGDVFMQKKLLALAVAGALLPAAAFAQSAVEIYGRANLSLGNWKATGSTSGVGDLDSRMRVVDSGSRVGFRINESLGGGMRAFAVIETGVNIDSGTNLGQHGGGNGSTGFWASRDSYLGLGGGWGDVRLGRQSIWWSNGIIAQTGANYIDSAADGLITGHMVAAPVTRQSSVISYNSPTVGGFNATLSFSPHDQEPGTFTGTGQEKGQIWGATARYSGGPLRAQFDYAVRQNAGNVDSRDNTGIKLGVGWAYAPGAQISGIIGQLENENSAAIGPIAGVLTIPAGADTKVQFWLLNWEHMFGQFQLLAQLYVADDIDLDSAALGLSGSQDDTGVQGFTLAAKYFLSKRTGVYVSYNNVKNDDLAWADLTGGGFSSANTLGLGPQNAGADVKSIGIGVIHNF
jgi:predicted porin